MDRAGLQELITAGEDFQVIKYFLQATMTIVVWDHLMTLSDEVKYVWKKEKFWTFWLFVVARYSILLFNIWLTISTLLLNVKYWSSVFANTFTASFWPGYTQEVCDRTVKLVGYYFVFVVTLGHIFLTMRVYVLTEASKYVLVLFGILVTSSSATGLWLVSVPSAGAVQMPKIPLDPFQVCIFVGAEAGKWAYRSQVAFADFVTFVCIVIFIFKLKADHGQSRMTRLMRAILGDGTLYFFVMVGFHVAMALFTVFSRPSILSFPSIAIVSLIPVMISRLMVSLRKVVDTSIIRVWDGDHFTVVETETTDLSDLTFSPPSFKIPFSHQDSRWPSSPDPTSSRPEV